MHKKKYRKNVAFTLMELMVAVTVFGIGIVYVARSLLNLTDAIDQARIRVLATVVLQEQLSRMQQEQYSDVQWRPQPVHDAVMLDTRKAELDVDCREVVPAELPQEMTAPPELWYVQVAVAWPQSGRRMQSALSTYMVFIPSVEPEAAP